MRCFSSYKQGLRNKQCRYNGRSAARGKIRLVENRLCAPPSVADTALCAVYQFQKVISFTREPRIRLQKWRENLKLFSLKMATAKQLGVYCGLTISRGSFFSKILRLHYSLEFYLSSWSQNIFEECSKFFDIRTWPLQTQKVVTTTRSTLEVHSHNRRSHK